MGKGMVCIAVYKTRDGKEKELLQLLGRHVPTLRQEGYATLRPPMFLKSAEDGAIVEIFEWVKESSGDEANKNPRVKEIWNAMELAAEIVPLARLKAAEMLFPRLEPLQGVVCR